MKRAGRRPALFQVNSRSNLHKARACVPGLLLWRCYLDKHAEAKLLRAEAYLALIVAQS